MFTSDLVNPNVLKEGQQRKNCLTKRQTPLQIVKKIFRSKKIHIQTKNYLKRIMFPYRKNDQKENSFP